MRNIRYSLANLRITNLKRFLKPLLVLVIVLVVIFGIKYLTGNSTKVSNAQLLNNKKEVKNQKITLNQTFDLQVSSKADIKPLKLTFTTAQLTNKITVSGKSKYSSDKSRFLMLNLLIENSNTQKINLKPQDLIRLIDNNNKKFAPRYYNDKIVISADAVKKDTVGFLVPENIKEFKIQYGLPDSADKKILELKF